MDPCTWQNRKTISDSGSSVRHATTVKHAMLLSATPEHWVGFSCERICMVYCAAEQRLVDRIRSTVQFILADVL
jgi:hypothetical protein